MYTTQRFSLCHGRDTRAKSDVTEEVASVLLTSRNHYLNDLYPLTFVFVSELIRSVANLASVVTVGEVETGGS